MRSCFDGEHRLPAGLDAFWGSNDKSSESMEPAGEKGQKAVSIGTKGGGGGRYE
jgi:hypothetical protein